MLETVILSIVGGVIGALAGVCVNLLLLRDTERRAREAVEEAEARHRQTWRKSGR